MVGEAEPTVGGRDPRFVVTNPKAGTFDARRLHEDIHRARGEMENRIKVQRMDPFADRASTGILDANRPGLWFSAFAHLLVEVPRDGMPVKTSLASATIGRIRPRFLKPAARGENQPSTSPRGMVFGVPESTRPPPGPRRVKRLTRPD